MLCRFYPAQIENLFMNLSGPCTTIHLTPKTKSNFLDDGQKIQKTTLANKITILTHTVPYVRSVTMGIWINVGSRDENDHEHGLAHFIEHMLFKGTKKRSAYQLAKAFDKIGGNSNAFTSVESTCYYAQVMDEHADKMIEILTDIFLNSRFLPQEIDHEIPVILQEIDMLEESPEDHVMALLDKKRWGNHPLGRSILGTPESIIDFSSNDLKEFFSKYYCPENTIIALAGNISHQKTVDLLGKSFEPLKTGCNSKSIRSIPKSNTGLCFESSGVEQYHLCLGAEGYAKKDHNRFKASLFTTILGGNMSSRLFQEVREKRGLAYSIYSFFNQFTDIGMLGVYAAVSKKNLIPIIKLIINEVEKIKNTKDSKEEIESAIAFTKGNLMLSMESTENLMVKLAENEILYKRYIPYEETISEIEKIKWSDIRNIAEMTYNQGNITASILGPKAVFTDEINNILGF